MRGQTSPIWLDREGDEILLRLVRAEAEDGNYYLMELKPEWLADNASDLMSAVTNFSEDASVLAVLFLCHASRDKSTVREFSDVLEQDSPGAARWLDEEQLLIGDVLKTEIEATIKGASASRP